MSTASLADSVAHVHLSFIGNFSWIVRVHLLPAPDPLPPLLRSTRYPARSQLNERHSDGMLDAVVEKGRTTRCTWHLKNSSSLVLATPVYNIGVTVLRAE